MSVAGTVKNGVVKLPAGAAWPDDTKVREEKLEPPSAGNSLTRRLRELSAKVSGLPSDLAVKHDDYLELTEEVKAKLNESRREIAAGHYATRQAV